MKLKLLTALAASAALLLPVVAEANNASRTGDINGSVNGQGFENASPTGIANGKGVGISRGKKKGKKKSAKT